MNIKSEVSRKGFIKHIGGIEFKKISENNFEFKTSVKEFNLNSQGISHGGYLATILDGGMGSAAHMVIGEGKNCVTISLDIKFIGGSKENDILVGKVLISKKTQSLVFVKADLFKSDQVIATASGIWKILK
ncbi:PaaI HGG motif-containing thioesterase, possibly involved in aromatic compounds catabolism [Candidatus Pelagibacterales bacterium]